MPVETSPASVLEYLRQVLGDDPNGLPPAHSRLIPVLLAGGGAGTSFAISQQIRTPFAIREVLFNGVGNTDPKSVSLNLKLAQENGAADAASFAAADGILEQYSSGPTWNVYGLLRLTDLWLPVYDCPRKFIARAAMGGASANWTVAILIQLLAEGSCGCEG